MQTTQPSLPARLACETLSPAALLPVGLLHGVVRLHAAGTDVGATAVHYRASGEEDGGGGVVGEVWSRPRLHRFLLY